MRSSSLLRSVVRSRLAAPTILLVSRYAANVIGPFVGLLLVRYLGPEPYGLYASATAVTSLFAVLCDFGLQQAALEMASTGQYPVSAVVRGILRLGTLYTLMAYSAVVLWVIAGPYQTVTAWLALVTALGFFQAPLLTAVTAALQVQGRYGRLALWNWLASLTSWAGTLAAILTDAGMYAVVTWPLVMGWVRTATMIMWERRALGLTGDRSGWPLPVPSKVLLRRSWRFGSSGIMHQLYHRSDAALLSLMRDPLEVGQYAVAFRLVELLNAFPGVVFNEVLYPKYFRWFAHARHKVAQYYEFTFKWMLMVGLIAASVTTIFGRDAVFLVFGSAQQPSAAFLSVMVWAVPARYLAASAGAVLTTGYQIEKKLKIQVGLALLNVGMNAFLIPRYGGMASAALMVATDAALLTAYTIAVHRAQGLFPWVSSRQLVLGVLLAGACLGIALLAPPEGVGIRAAATMVAIAMAGVYGWLTLSASDWSELRRLLGRADVPA